MLEISVFWGHLLKVRVLYGMLTVETPQLSSELEKKHSAVSQNLIFFSQSEFPSFFALTRLKCQRTNYLQLDTKQNTWKLLVDVNPRIFLILFQADRAGLGSVGS